MDNLDFSKLSSEELELLQKRLNEEFAKRDENQTNTKTMKILINHQLCFKMYWSDEHRKLYERKTGKQLSEHDWYNKDLRVDPVMIEVVKEIRFQRRQSHFCHDMWHIIEIPVGVDWDIEEYADTGRFGENGKREQVVEKHRVWKFQKSFDELFCACDICLARKDH